MEDEQLVVLDAPNDRPQAAAWLRRQRDLEQKSAGRPLLAVAEFNRRSRGAPDYPVDLPVGDVVLVTAILQDVDAASHAFKPLARTRISLVPAGFPVSLELGRLFDVFLCQLPLLFGY